MTPRMLLAVVRHEEEKRDLVRDCLLPISITLASEDGIDQVFLRRHWKHGPQVQLWVSGPDAPRLEALLRSQCGEVTRWLAENPSTATLDTGDHLRRSAALGRLELESPPYEPVLPDDSVHVLADTGRGGLLTDDRSLAARDRLCDIARATVAQVLTRDVEGHTRLEDVLRLLTATAATYPDGGLARGFFSFKSHLEDFLHDNDEGGRVRVLFERRHDAARVALEELVRSVADETGERGAYKGDDPLLASWCSMLATGWKEALDLAAARAITPLPDQAYVDRARTIGDDLVRKWRGGDDRTYSDFHRRLREVSFTGVEEGRVFAAYRFITNTVYEILPLLDLSPVERYFLCHVLAEASQSVVGSPWTQLLDEGQRTVAS